MVDQDAIATARAEIDKATAEGDMAFYQIVAGEINDTAVDWNPGWSYHLDPTSIILVNSLLKCVMPRQPTSKKI